ncbi:hypothetical protein D3C85_1347610 [compost metagenome]
MPQIRVFAVLQLAIEELVDHVQLFQLGQLFLAGQQALPRIDPLLPLPQWPIELLRARTDQ